MFAHPEAGPAPELSPEQEAALQRSVQQATQRRAEAAAQQIAHERHAQRSAMLTEQRNEAKKKEKRKRTAKNAFLTVLLIVIISAAGFAGWYYWWTVHATFEYTLKPVVVLEGADVSPNDFLSSGEDMERVSAVFRRPGFRPKAGQQDVPLTLTLGWRTVEASAKLYVLTPVKQIYHEFTEVGPVLTPISFLSNAGVAENVDFDVRFAEQPFLLEEYPVGEFTLRLVLNETPFDVILYVTDTTPPSATAIPKSIHIGEEVEPEDFVVDVFDASPIASIEFVEAPDIFSRFDQIVEVVIEDVHGNLKVFASSLSVQLNESPPVFEGLKTIETMVGSPILYRQGVTALDDFGREIEFEVDSSGVDQYTEGLYTAIFWVEDFTGFRTEVEVKVNVINIDPEYVNTKVDEILAGIVNDGMSQLDKVIAIHRWVRANINYSVTRGGPESAYEGAYIALQDRRGNCFIFYSISELLLTRANIPNMRIQRIEGTPTRHRWNLVNPDGLGWHHFDAYPTRIGQSDRMAHFTTSEARSFAHQIQAVNNMRDYYTFDVDKYPETVE